MHEYHLVESIVKQVIENALSNHASRVTKVNLMMGELSGLEESSVRLYFGNISKGTIAEGAELSVKIEPLKLKCEKCGFIFERKNKEFNCPQCSTLGIPIQVSKGLYVQDIEIES
jgi:hydrogenase nickel incorporation protein HypA/HybF